MNLEDLDRIFDLDVYVEDSRSNTLTEVLPEIASLSPTDGAAPSTVSGSSAVQSPAALANATEAGREAEGAPGARVCSDSSCKVNA
jgi:hypothetical protein